MFQPPKGRLPSYSTKRPRPVDSERGAVRILSGEIFRIQPLAGETIAADGKVLRGYYQLESDNPYSEPHPAIMLVTAYIVERGLILEP